jgi:hypothetical protein
MTQQSFAEVPISSKQITRMRWSVGGSVDVATQLAAIPKVVLGHSIAMRVKIDGPWSELVFIYGTSEKYKTAPGVVTTITRRGGVTMHQKSATGVGARGSGRIESVAEISRFERGLADSSEFWLLWREGVLFVGCGAELGKDVLMIGDISTGVDRFENNPFVTDDVTGIFLASDRLVAVYADFQALWINEPECKLSRALCGVTPALLTTSAALKESTDKTLGRLDWVFILSGVSEPSLINAVEVAWWLRFIFAPAKKPNSILADPEPEKRGQDICLKKVELMADQKNFVIHASVTWEIWLSLLCQTHAIPKHPRLSHLRVLYCDGVAPLAVTH